ncbi:MAG: hypothetical protein AAB316_13890 [Bacteroidota bacterium]
MNQFKPVIDTGQVLQTIAQMLDEIKTGLQPEKLSAADRAELIEGFLEIEAQAYKCKLGLRIRELAEVNPDATTREAMLQVLSTLPNDLPANMLSELAKYAAKEWERRTELAAA